MSGWGRMGVQSPWFSDRGARGAESNNRGAGRGALGLRKCEPNIGRIIRVTEGLFGWSVGARGLADCHRVSRWWNGVCRCWSMACVAGREEKMALVNILDFLWRRNFFAVLRDVSFLDFSGLWVSSEGFRLEPVGTAWNRPGVGAGRRGAIGGGLCRRTRGVEMARLIEHVSAHGKRPIG